MQIVLAPLKRGGTPVSITWCDDEEEMMETVSPVLLVAPFCRLTRSVLYLSVSVPSPGTAFCPIRVMMVCVCDQWPLAVESISMQIRFALWRF